LSEVYVKNIVTIIPHHLPTEVDSFFVNTKIWLGVEISGFAKAGW